MDIAIFGGSFNPVHMGHHEIVLFLLESLGFRKVIMVPAHQNPLKDSPPIIPESVRWQMLLNTFHAHDSVDVSDFEIQSQKVSYSYKTLNYFNKIYPEDRLFLILGEDSFASFPQWVNIETILSLSKILVFPRPDLRSKMLTPPYDHGYSQHVTWLDILIPDISATKIRESDLETVIKKNWLHPAALEEWKTYQQSEAK